MELSIATDYACDHGDPSPYLRRIADAGFTHVHWCHCWCGDHLYSAGEVTQIARWLSDFGLRLLDLHGSIGATRNWASADEAVRQGGLELVRNRVDMTARLGGDAVVMHVPDVPSCPPLHKSLDELRGYVRERGLRLALENGIYPALRPLLDAYEPDYVGLCYDSGHSNFHCLTRAEFALVRDRLLVLHLNDNDGTGDQHKPLFMGTVPWEQLAGLIATSSYRKCLNQEISMRAAGIPDEDAFLRYAHESGSRFARMVDAQRRGGASLPFAPGTGQGAGTS